jgi:hypothetical protein
MAVASSEAVPVICPFMEPCSLYSIAGISSSLQLAKNVRAQNAPDNSKLFFIGFFFYITKII